MLGCKVEFLPDMTIWPNSRCTANSRPPNCWLALVALMLAAATLAGCSGAASSVAAARQTAAPQPAPPASQTGGFNGARAWGYLKTIVDFGPRPPNTPNIRREQRYLASELSSFGCEVSQDHFQAQTGVGLLHMDNIVAKIPGKSPGTILLLSHYDTLRLPGFVGADDGGSSTAILLELAHDLCGHSGPLTIWIAFLDGEEEQTNFTSVYQAQSPASWTTDNNTFGSRELVARIELSGKLKQIKAVLLSDMDGDADLRMTRDSTSTPWLEGLVWSGAKRLGYGRYFTGARSAVSDDHTPFLQKGVSAVDLIGNVGPVTPAVPFGIFWHTTEDTLKHCSPHSLAVVGHVFLATIKALDEKFASGITPNG
jgi:glutaminyl-peptide cyclotransferase